MKTPHLQQKNESKIKYIHSIGITDTYYKIKGLELALFAMLLYPVNT